MHWTWDEDKNQDNIQKHGFSFETALLVLDDPLSVTDDDPYPREVRLRTIGVTNYVTLMVVHTKPEYDPRFALEVGRIISARLATAHERRIYEEF